MASDNNNNSNNNYKSQGHGNTGKRSNSSTKNNKNNNKSGNNKDKFKGKCKELEGVIFDANRYNQADEYIKAVQEIAEYVGSNYDDGADVRQSIEDGKKMVIPKPVKPQVDSDGNLDETDEMIWKKEIDYYVKRVRMLDSNLRKAFSLVRGQCTDVMREKLESLKNFEDIKRNYDVLSLLEQMKVITFKFEDQKYPFSSVYYENKRFYNYKQAAEDTNNMHYDKLNNLVSVVEFYNC